MNRQRVIIKSLCVNGALSLGKFIGGFVFRSAALIADAVHSLSDFLSDILVMVGIRQSERPPDQEHPYGHGKIEYVFSMLLGFGIIFAAAQIIYNVIINITNDIQVPASPALVVIGVVIVSKYVLSRYILSRGKMLGSQVLIASGKESFAEMLGSVVVLLAVTVSIVGERYGLALLVYGDLIGGLIIGIFLLKVAIGIVAQAITSMLGKNAPTEVLDTTRASIQAVKGVIRVDRLRMIVYGHYYQVIVSIRVDGSITVKMGHDIADNVQSMLKENNPKIAHVTVHVNPEE